MNESQILALQKRVGTTPDGFWGPKSISACQKHLKALMPAKNPWPKSDEKSLSAFYGPAYSEARLVRVNVPEGVTMLYGGSLVMSIYCHERVAESLLRILTKVAKVCPGVLLKYAGVWNPRTMRGGTRPSLHARGAAIDLDPSNNGNASHWPIKATMPIEVMECFAAEGWLCAGACWHRDAMHFQATQ